MQSTQPVMSYADGRDKALPAVPVDSDDARETVENKELPSSNTTKALPPINVEKTLSEAEIIQLHELWNGAVLSARAHRKKRHAPHRIPAPICIPNAEDTSLTLACSSGGSSVEMTPPATGTRKRRGFFSARPISETQEEGKKGSTTLEMLRTIAQDRLMKKLRYAKSAPNLGNGTAPLRQRVIFRPPVLPDDATPRDMGGTSPQDRTVPRQATAPETVLQQEDADKNGIYFTIDPNWRASRGSVQFEPITPIPDSPTSIGRPDSPLLHRPHSLDQLSFAAERADTATDFPKEYRRDMVLHPIDELHAYLEP